MNRVAEACGIHHWWQHVESLRTHDIGPLIRLKIWFTKPIGLVCGTVTSIPASEADCSGLFYDLANCHYWWFLDFISPFSAFYFGQIWCVSYEFSAQTAEKECIIQICNEPLLSQNYYISHFVVQKFVLSLPYKLIKVNNIYLKISFDPSYIICYDVPPNSQETAA